MLSSLSRQEEKQPPQSQGSIPFADSSARAPSTRRTSPLHRNKVYPSNGSLGCKYSSILASFRCNTSLPIPTTFHLFILCAGTQPLQYDLTLKLPSSSSLPLPSTLYSDPEHPVNLTNSSTQRSFLHPAVSTYTKEWLKIRSYPTESSASNLASFRIFFSFSFIAEYSLYQCSKDSERARSGKLRYGIMRWGWGRERLWRVGGIENGFEIGVRGFRGRWLAVGMLICEISWVAEIYKGVEMRGCWVRCAIYYVCTRL